MVNWYKDIGELVTAFDTGWFPQILQGALQNVFQYDYFLLVLYERNRSLRVIRSDFCDVTINQSLRYLEEETYVGEAMYRLFGADRLSSGIYDMAELCEQAAKLPSVDIGKLPHMIKCEDEEMGYLTIGWPKFLQETCIVIPVGDRHCAAISLYNSGLAKETKASKAHLQTVFPAISSLVEAYFCAPVGKKWARIENPTTLKYTFASRPMISNFFATRYKVDLTPKEVEVFARLLYGSTVSAIANELCISIHTAKTHRRNVYSKIGHGNQLELMNQFNLYQQEI